MTPLLRGTAAAAMLLAFGVKAQETTVTTTATSSVTQACSTVLTPSYPPPVVAPGWKAQLIATGLSRPRSIKFDGNGGLLVIEARKGLTHLAFTDDGDTCLSVKRNTTLITDEELNHGLELSEDGQTIYVSTQENVDRYSYDVNALTVGNRTRLVTNMTNPGVGHVSRTLLLSKKQPDLLLVSRGSATNLDPLAADESTGVSQIRAFNISIFNVSNAVDLERPYSYPTDGLLVGWGLRNSVGVAEHPLTGGVYSVENSADNIVRLSTDIHEDNPGEELNFHGFLNDTSTLGANHGYPGCFALWNTTDFPSPGDLTVGSQFSLDNNATHNDTDCAQRTTAPRLTFQAHTAPLDIKFRASGEAAFISFHGSWNRDSPAGYKLSYVSFSADRGEPTEPSDSLTAVKDVITAPDVSACSGQGGCFRPVGLAFDATGERLFVSSDATGEIWVVMRDGAGGYGNGNGNGGATGTSTGPSTGTGVPGSSTSTAAATAGLRYQGVGGAGWLIVSLTAFMMAAGGLALVG
ncbi:soluble quino protein glucose dehydrogenase [Parathielavia appendiculata]|uniref:Soluble quino protein glucose dehydrogenase n=1 Tax=Parathielavia appendiculata TaxID=2587402 RepID=A0AAN6U7I9_9PEZI|nr:soluble quino protein glucose dehydrogenase [Parathielavia appendiculata]